MIKFELKKDAGKEWWEMVCKTKLDPIEQQVAAKPFNSWVIKGKGGDA